MVSSSFALFCVCVWHHKCLLMLRFSLVHFVGRNLVNVSLFCVFVRCTFRSLVCGYCVAIFLHLNIYSGTKCKLCAIIEFHEFLSLPGGYFSKFVALIISFSLCLVLSLSSHGISYLSLCLFFCNSLFFSSSVIFLCVVCCLAWGFVAC